MKNRECRKCDSEFDFESVQHTQSRYDLCPSCYSDWKGEHIEAEKKYIEERVEETEKNEWGVLDDIDRRNRDRQR